MLWTKYQLNFTNLWPIVQHYCLLVSVEVVIINPL